MSILAPLVALFSVLGLGFAFSQLDSKQIIQMIKASMPKSSRKAAVAELKAVEKKIPPKTSRLPETNEKYPFIRRWSILKRNQVALKKLCMKYPSTVRSNYRFVMWFTLHWNRIMKPASGRLPGGNVTILTYPKVATKTTWDDVKAGLIIGTANLSGSDYTSIKKLGSKEWVKRRRERGATHQSFQTYKTYDRTMEVLADKIRVGLRRRKTFFLSIHTVFKKFSSADPAGHAMAIFFDSRHGNMVYPYDPNGEFYGDIPKIWVDDLAGRVFGADGLFRVPRAKIQDVRFDVCPSRNEPLPDEYSYVGLSRCVDAGGKGHCQMLSVFFAYMLHQEDGPERFKILSRTTAHEEMAIFRGELLRVFLLHNIMGFSAVSKDTYLNHRLAAQYVPDVETQKNDTALLQFLNGPGFLELVDDFDDVRKLIKQGEITRIGQKVVWDWLPRWLAANIAENIYNHSNYAISDLPRALERIKNRVVEKDWKDVKRIFSIIRVLGASSSAGFRRILDSVVAKGRLKDYLGYAQCVLADKVGTQSCARYKAYVRLDKGGLTG